VPRPARNSNNTAILLSLGAFVLRVVRLDYRALWWDEGRNIFFARLDWVSAAEISVRSGDTNPPIYRLLLGGWMQLAGASPFSVRLLSVFFGVLAVALLYRLAAELYGERVAAIAAALAAVAPPLVYYSQEAKGYPLVVLAAVWSAWLWLRLHRRLGVARSSALWAWFGIATLLAVGAHYFALLFLFAQNLWTVAWWRDNAAIRARGGRWQHLSKWLGVQALALMPLLVYAWWSVAALMGSSGRAFFGVSVPVFPRLTDVARWGATTTAQWPHPTAHLLNFMRAFGHEIAGGPAAAPAMAAGAGLALAVPLWVGWRDRVASGRFRRANMALWLGAPLLLSAFFSLRFSYYFPRFLIFTLPAVLLLAAAGTERLWRRSRAAPLLLGLLLFGSWAAVLGGHYTDPSDPAEDWRGLAQRFARLQRRGDIAVHSYDWIQGYLHSYLPATAEPDYLFFAGAGPTELERAAGSRSRVWFLDYQTTPFAVGNWPGEWMRMRYGLATSEAFGNAQLTLFVRPLETKIIDESARFANGIGLRWGAIAAVATPGDALAVELIWRAPATPAGAYQVFLHLLDGDGRLQAGRDGGPVNDLRPTVTWQRGERIRSAHALLLPLELLHGEYQLRAGMYSLESGARLLTTEGADSVLLGRVRVSSP
jgi:mannosyltransferase|tara:strand:+ start:1429 stop:3381 length:1953 start_codon:yes stop_codon:yes gene_type:complete